MCLLAEFVVRAVAVAILSLLLDLVVYLLMRLPQNDSLIYYPVHSHAATAWPTNQSNTLTSYLLLISTSQILGPSIRHLNPK